VSDDLDIEAWLSTLGFDLPEGRASARGALEAAGLTRPGKARMSTAKEERARGVLEGAFFLHCATPACIVAAAASGKVGVRTGQRPRCAHCGGSDNRRAEAALLAACQRTGVRRLVVVGGNVGAAVAIIFGILAIVSEPGVLTQGWLHLKLLFVLIILAVHYRLYQRIRALEEAPLNATRREFSVIHGLVSALLLGTLVLVFLKPF